MVHRGEKCYWLAAHHIIDEESQKKPAPIFVEDSLRSSTSATQKEERGQPDRLTSVCRPCHKIRKQPEKSKSNLKNPKAT
jgi:hypothetical protein